MTRDPELFARVVREVADQVQILIYRRESSPIRDRAEALTDLGEQVRSMPEAAMNGKKRWRRAMVELAAYAVYAAVSDE